MHCSSVLKPNSAFYSLQGLLSGPVAIATLWQDIARISRNGSPDAVHSAPVEELHSPEETKGTFVQAPTVPPPNTRLPPTTFFQINVYLLKLVSNGRKMRIWLCHPRVVLSRAIELFTGGEGNRRDLPRKLSPIDVSRL